MYAHIFVRGLYLELAVGCVPKCISRIFEMKIHKICIFFGQIRL